LEPKDRKVDVAQALRAYQNILDHGKRDEDGFVYRGLRASTDFDGYTVTLSDGVISLRIFFHNRFAIEPNNGKDVDQFLTRLKRVAKADV
jgi:hypothetical protein